MKSRPNNRLPSFRPRVERLELRALMAADLCFHNIESPEDVDGTGTVDPLDALAIINELNGSTSTSAGTTMTDVDADASTTPLDALAIINYLNRGERGDRSSSISSASRIARIEQSIAQGTLATRFSLDHAIEVLAVLQSGGRPELGETSTSRLTDSTAVTTEILTKVVNKLTKAGVAEETIATIQSEVTTSIEAGTAPTWGELKTRLTELGVDLTLLTAGHPASTHHNNLIDTTTEVETLTAKLTAASVATETVTTITTELNEAITAGTPFTMVQLKDRLTELGVDVATLFPNPTNDRHGDKTEGFITMLSSKLEDAGVSAEIITTISEEIRAANDAGDRLSLDEINARLTELGVDMSTIDLSPPTPPVHSRPHSQLARRRSR